MYKIKFVYLSEVAQIMQTYIYMFLTSLLVARNTTPAAVGLLGGLICRGIYLAAHTLIGLLHLSSYLATLHILDGMF